jgi:hypothetical protein
MRAVRPLVLTHRGARSRLLLILGGAVSVIVLLACGWLWHAFPFQTQSVRDTASITIKGYVAIGPMRTDDNGSHPSTNSAVRDFLGPATEDVTSLVMGISVKWDRSNVPYDAAPAR